MERIRPPFGKVIKRAIHTRETFSHLGENCSIGSKADLGAWVPAAMVLWEQKEIFYYL